MIRRVKYSILVLWSTVMVFADEVQSTSTAVAGFLNVSMSFKDLLVKWGVALGWIIVASIGFAFGVGISIKVFDLLTKNIDEWEEVKKKNWVVGMILVALIVMIGLIIIKIL